MSIKLPAGVGSALIFLFILSLSSAAAGAHPMGGQGQDKVCILYFYGQGCSACAKASPFIESIEERHADVVQIRRYEIYHNPGNFELFSRFCDIHNIPPEERGVPLVAINNRSLLGMNQIKEGLEQEIQKAVESGDRACPIEEEVLYHSLPNATETEPTIHGTRERLTLPLILMAGLIDGINPCAFAVLIFLLTYLLAVSGSRKRLLRAGTVYIVAVYTTYLLAGIGLLTVVQISGFRSIIFGFAAVLALGFGAVNIKDYFWYGKGPSLKIPSLGKGVIEAWTKKANIPAAIVLGFLVSMFELPCTGGIYLAVLAIISREPSAILYLFAYNLVFVLPLAAILLAVYLGMKTERIERWRESKRNAMKLCTGALLIGLGSGLLLGWF